MRGRPCPSMRMPGRLDRGGRLCIDRIGFREREASMRTARFYLGVSAIALSALLSGPAGRGGAQQATVAGINVGAGALGGVVTGPNGPEAGVWVIAETKDLPTKLAK